MQPRPSLEKVAAKLHEINEPTAQQVKEVLRPHLSRFISPRSITSLIKGMSSPDVALKVMQALQAEGLQVNLFHFSALLGVSERSGSWQLCMGILSQMSESRQVPDVLCYMPALRACQKMSAWIQALQLFQSMEASKDAISYNAMIGTAKGVGNWQLAIALLTQMLNARLQASSIIMGTVMSACQEANQWPSVLHLLGQMPSFQLQPDLICYNIAISCESPGAWRISLRCLDEILSRSLEATNITFNSLITACGKATQWQAALELLGQMGSLTDVISYNAAVAACAQQWQMALQIFAEMLPESPSSAESETPKLRRFFAAPKAKTVRPDLITYNAVVTACEKGNQWHLALSIIDQMQSNNEAPNCVTYQGLLSACEKESCWADRSNGFSAEELSVNSVRDSSLGNSSLLGSIDGMFDVSTVCVTPTNIYTISSNQMVPKTAGQWEVAVKVLDHMLEQKEIPSAMHAGSTLHALQKEKGPVENAILQFLAEPFNYVFRACL